MKKNKANLRDLIAATGLVIVFKFEIGFKSSIFLGLCDFEIWWMTSKIDRAPLLYYIKLFASFQSHRWIQTGVTVQKRSIRVKIGDYFCPVWPWNLENDLQNITASLLYMKLCASFQSHLWIQIRVTIRKHSIRIKISIFLSSVTYKFDGWPWKNNRAPIQCYFTLCASFQSHLWIQTWVTVRKRLNCVLTSVTLTFDLDLCHGHHFSPC